MLAQPLAQHQEQVQPLAVVPHAVTVLVALTFASWDDQGSWSDRGTLGSAAR